MQIVDPKGNKVCEIHEEDPERWIRTNYKDSIACTRKLCTRSQWDKMDIVQQVRLCDCWEALAVMEYLDVGYDDGNRFEIDEYEGLVWQASFFVCFYDGKNKIARKKGLSLWLRL